MSHIQKMILQYTNDNAVLVRVEIFWHRDLKD